MRNFMGLWLFCSLVMAEEPGNDWPSWRGPNQNGTAQATGLISNWSKEGGNLIWRADFTGRSTPVVFDGKVYVIGRAGSGVEMRERVAAFDARDGKPLWDFHYNVYDTAVPFKRVAWTSPVVDPETGYVYTVGGGGLVHCFDDKGHVKWTRHFIEDFGAITGYGGRTISPVVDEDLVIISFVTSSWGPFAAPKQRFFALDKKSGVVRWISEPGDVFKTPNIYSTPVVAEIGGQRLLIGGNADGSIHAIQARNGEPVWSFDLSKRGMNSSVAVAGQYVYAVHGEENIDQPFMGRVVCIDATGKGNVTATHEVWRVEKIEAGYTAPAVHDGRVYVIENSANMHCIDAREGKTLWTTSLGTVGKGSPVLADGKLYVTETNGKFFIFDPGNPEPKKLDEEFLTVEGGRYAEIYGSPAIAYGRIYFTTEEGLYCLGNPSTPFRVRSSSVHQPPAPPADAKAAHLQVTPGEIILKPNAKYSFKARLYDENGLFIKEAEARWSLRGLEGTLTQDGVYTPADKAQAGLVVAAFEGLQGQARVRVFPPYPWFEDFENIPVDKNPSYWVRAGSARSPASKFIVKQAGDNKVLVKPTAERGIQRATVYLGPHTSRGYVIQADVKGFQRKRFRPDIGLHSHGYTLDLMGNHQRLMIRSWISENRVRETNNFGWDPEVWYTLKLRVDYQGGKALIKGKAWPTAEEEPEAWTITAEDPVPTLLGSPGLYGFSTAEIHYDNIKITEKTP